MEELTVICKCSHIYREHRRIWKQNWMDCFHKDDKGYCLCMSFRKDNLRYLEILSKEKDNV